MNLKMFRTTHRQLSGAYNSTRSLWFFIIPWKVVGRVVGRRRLTTRPNILPHMKNQRLRVQFKAPDDRQSVALDKLSFILIWNKIYLIHCCIFGFFFMDCIMMHGSTKIKYTM
jgi:hypothetical protein